MNIFSTPKFNHPGFNFFLRRSTMVHGLLILCTLTGGKIAFDIQQKERDKNLQLIQASVRVDMVAMPTMTINELKNLSSGVEEAKKEEKASTIVEKTVLKEGPKEEPKVLEKEDPSDQTEAFKEAQSKKRMDFLSKLKTIGNKKVDAPKENNVKADKGLYGEKDNALKNLVLSGNKLNQGTAMTGDGSAAEMTAFQTYATRLPDIIKAKDTWRLPDFLRNKNLKARVRVFLNMNGEVTRATIYQSSGETEFDERAISAVKSAAPFPAPKEEIGRRAMSGDIILGFPL